jgi:hypothetical protein
VRSLSEADKNYLKLLILDCKTFHLNEKESIAYISNKLNRKIARTLYYICKKEMSDNDSFTYIFSDSKWEKSFSFIHEIAIRNRILNSSVDIRIRSHNAWNDPEFVDKYSDRFFADGYALVEQTKRMSARINSQQYVSSKNFASVPSNATIREEYVKCGNPYCYRCKHGPYYYAYWKEGRRLNKKYIGKYDPRKDTKNT